MVEDNIFFIIGIALTAIGLIMNPLRKFSAQRMVALGVAILLFPKFQFIPLVFASFLLVFNSEKKFKPRRVVFLIPFLFLLEQSLLANIVLAVAPNVEEPFLIGMLVLSVVLFLMLQNEDFLKRTLNG